MKFTKPRDYPPANRSGGNPGYDRAKEAAIERRRSAYIHLTCGHLTTWEDDERYSFCRPARDKIWCEKCTKWKKAKPKKSAKDFPNEPLF